MCAYIRSSVRTRAHIYARALVSACVFVCLHAKCKYIFLRAFACVHLRACVHADLIKKQNAFENQIISTFKRALGSETFRMYYMCTCVCLRMYVYVCDNCLLSLLSPIPCCLPHSLLDISPFLPPSLPPSLLPSLPVCR